MHLQFHFRQGEMRSVCIFGRKILTACSRGRCYTATLHLPRLNQKLPITVPLASARCAEKLTMQVGLRPLCYILQSILQYNYYCRDFILYCMLMYLFASNMYYRAN